MPLASALVLSVPLVMPSVELLAELLPELLPLGIACVPPVLTPSALRMVDPFPMPLLMLGLEVTAGLLVTVGELGVRTVAASVALLPFGVGGIGGVVGELVAGVAVVPMGVDGGVVAEFCATARPTAPNTAATTAEEIRN